MSRSTGGRGEGGTIYRHAVLMVYKLNVGSRRGEGEGRTFCSKGMRGRGEGRGGEGGAAGAQPYNIYIYIYII